MRLALFTVLMATQAATQGGPPRNLANLTVCDVLAGDPTRLNHKVIRLTGRLGATGEGTWLSGACEKDLVTKGLAWGNDISVYVDPSDDNASRSWRKMLNRLDRLHAVPARDNVWVTVIGRLETRSSMEDEVVQMPYGPARAGFGHMGDSPAEINIVSFEDVWVEKQRGK